MKKIRVILTRVKEYQVNGITGFMLMTWLVVAGLGDNATFAQDPHFSQYFNVPLYVNPALTGSGGGSRVTSAYRNQWPGLSGNYSTYLFSYDQLICKAKLGVGILALHDRAGQGTLKTTRISWLHSQLFTIKDRVGIRIGMQGTLLRRSVDMSKLTFGDSIDPRYGLVYATQESMGRSSRVHIDLSAGMAMNGKRWNVGLAVHHLLTPDEGLSGQSTLPMKFTVHSGYVIGKDSANFRFGPHILFMQQQGFAAINMGMNFKFKQLVWGISFRKDDAPIFLAGWQSKRFRAVYSYDHTISKLASRTAGSHEVTFQYLFNRKEACNSLLILSPLF